MVKNNMDIILIDPECNYIQQLTDLLRNMGHKVVASVMLNMG
jgi:hypothetical protein